MNNHDIQLPASASDVEPFYVGDRYVQPALNRISVGDRSTQIEPRIMHVLACLASRPGEVIPRAALIDVVWSKIIVNEEALTHTISQLRRALGDDPKSPRYIETIHKGGYRLIAPVAKGDPTERAGDAHPAGGGPEEPGPGEGPKRGPRLLTGIGVFAVLAVLIAIVAFTLQHRRSTPSMLSPSLAGTPFTSYPGREICASISPDGTRIAFSWDADEDHRYDLFVKQRNTESPLRLTDTDGDEYYAAWSPDGSVLAFVYDAEEGVGIYTMPSLGGALRKIIDVPEGCFGLDWSSDGEWLVYTSRPSPRVPWQLFLYSFSAEASQPLTSPPRGFGGDISPAFSPDSESVVFIRGDRSGLQDLHIVSVDGGEPRRATFARHRVQGVDWTPDGQHLVFSTGAMYAGELRLWRMDLADGSREWLPTRGARPRRPSIASRGVGLVYEEQNIQVNILRIAVADARGTESTGVPIVASTRNDYEGEYSPDGNRIAFISTRSGSPQLWICDREGGSPRQLTELADAAISGHFWSPDGKSIGFEAALETHSAIYFVNVETGEIHPLSTSDQHEWCLGWSQDGRWLYGKSERGADWQVWKKRLDGSETVSVMEEDVLRVVETDGGQRLYFSLTDTIGIWTARVAELPDYSHVDTRRPTFCSGWRLGGTGVYYFTREDPGMGLWFLDFSTNEASNLAELPSLGSFGLDVSPDGQWVMYDEIAPIGADLVLVDEFH
jgi:Tol biopolymer transport system component/DNA-binding winged helix-turn-helix (wHTH) protein